MSILSKLRLTVLPNGLASFLVDSNAEEKTANFGPSITTDSGKTFVSKLDGIEFNVPDIAIGNVFTFVNMAEDGQAEMNISPGSTDGITYAGSSTDDKDLINTKATAKKGDYVTIASLNGTVAWQVVAIRGIWAKEA